MLELNDLRPRRGGKVDNYIDEIQDFENEKTHKMLARDRQKTTHRVFMLMILIIGAWFLYYFVTKFDVTSNLLRSAPSSEKRGNSNDNSYNNDGIGLEDGIDCFLN
jgi:hypothetical protein